MMMQQMIMQRLMFGIYVPPLPGFIPPLPVGQPPISTPPPPPPPSTPPQPEPPISPSSMDVSIGTASPSSTASYSTYYTPSPLASPQSFSTAWDEAEQRPLSPSFFAGMHQNGQDMLWDYQLQQSTSSSDESDNGVGYDDNDDDDDYEEADVVFVRQYQRPNDIIPAEGTDEYWSMRLLDAERRANAAEQRADDIEAMLCNRIERTSCAVCTKDLLKVNTLRMPCGHINCAGCLARIAKDAANDVNSIKCPQCREVYYSTDNCMKIIFS